MKIISKVENEKILIISHQGLGDIVTSIPIYKAVIERYPNAIITSTVKTNVESELLRTQKLADKFLYLNTPNMSKWEKLIWIKNILFKRYDYIVVPYGIDINFSIALRFLSVSKNIVCGYNNFFQKKLLTQPVLIHRHGKNVFNNQQIARFFIDNACEYLPELHVISENIFKKYKLDSKKKYIAIHPGSGAIESHKRWDSFKYSALIKKILQSYDYNFIILGVHNELDVCDEIINNIDSNKDRVINLVGKTSVDETIYILSKSVCLISADSGVMHMASAVNLKTFTICGPVSSLKSAPFWNDGKVISNLPPCAPCYPDRQLGCKNPICMKSVTPDMVLSSMKSASII